MTPDEAFENFKTLHTKYEGKEGIFNEADTRAKIIDVILKNCLAWREDSIQREDYVNEGYTDYQLLRNNICVLVIEAKKSGDYFEIPQTKKRRTYKISGSISTVENLMDAVEQVRTYCSEIGCKYAAVFNGYQLVLFSAITIGKRWTEGYCTVFHSLDDIEKNFNYFWNILSEENVARGSLINYIDIGKRDLSFEKLTALIHNADKAWARNQLYTYIQPISDFVFSELLDEARTEVLKKCYVFDRVNTQLGEELEGYFVDKLPHFMMRYRIKDIVEREAKAGSFQKEYAKIISGEQSGSLIVLLGGIGCGKSTFLHRFFKIILSERENLLWFNLDFRIAPPKEVEIEDFILDEMFRQWKSEHEKNLGPVLEEVGFNVSSDDLKDYFSKLFKLLHHLKFSITLIIDNVDQHEMIFQEKLFLVANHLTSILNTVTIVALREETFITSTKTGVFDAFYIPKFHLASPNFLNLIKRRIDFTIQILSDDSTKEILGLKEPKVIEDIIRYFKILRHSLGKENYQSRRIVYFIDNVSVGNMREGLRMFNHFIVSGNTNVQEIFEKSKPGDPYQIAYHQFIKSTILGEYMYYSQDRSHLMNIFDFDPSIGDSHFNNLRILQCLLDRYNKKSPIGRGYVEIDELIRIGEDVSIRREVILDSLLRMSGFNLVEYDNQSKTDIESAAYAKITPAGKYYLTDLIYEFAYLDPLTVDTPISDKSLVKRFRYLLNETEIVIRLDRSNRFIKYLVNAENDDFQDHPQYLHSDFTNHRFASGILEKFGAFKSDLEKRLEGKDK